MEAELETTSQAEPVSRRGRLRMAGLLTVAVLGVGLAWIRLADGRGEERVVARGDDITLRQADIEAMLGDLDAATRERLLQDTAALTALVRRELGRRMLQQRALAEDWHERKEVRDRLERLRLDYIATSFLEAQAAPPASFPSAAEVETAYHLNQQRLLQPRQFHLAQVYLQRPADAGQVQSARNAATALAAELRKAPARFAEVARSKSDDAASAPKGGDLGWLPEDQIQPGIRAVVIGLAPGDVSEAIEAADGWHILRLLETKAAAVAPLAQVRESLVAALRQQRAQENAAAYVAKLMAEKQAAVDEITLVRAQEALR